MGDLDKALGDISSIRMQMARSTEFRGYGPATLAMTAVLAIVASSVQALMAPQTTLVPQAATGVHAYLVIWAATAVLSATVVGVQMYTRTRRMHSGISHEMLGMAVEQFLPSLAAGMLLTVVLARDGCGTAWLLPGLWQIVYGLGVFASCRFLPRWMQAAGAWYLASGLACLAMGPSASMTPWAMGIPFGVGQSLIAAILFFHRNDAQQDTEENADEL